MSQNDQQQLAKARLKITTDGRPYDIRLGDFSAMDEVLYEQATGKGLMDIFMGGGITVRQVAGYVWLERQRYEKKLSFEKVFSKFKVSDLDTLEILDGTEEQDDEEGVGSAPES